MADKKLDLGARIGSMILDHLIMTFASFIFAIPAMIDIFSKAFSAEMSHEGKGMTFGGNLVYIYLIGFAVYFCKDCVNGRSPAKRILGLQVVNHTTGEPATPVRCVVRNIFICIWPIEFFVTLVSPSRRLGDLVAGTRVVVFEATRPQPSRVDPSQLALSLGIGYGAILLMMIPFFGLMSKVENIQSPWDATTYNEKLSKATEKYFLDSLGVAATPDVRVYDRMKDRDLKYVSVILRLRDDHLNDDSDYEELKSSTTSLLLKKFPEKTFAGKIQYEYKGSGSLRWRSYWLDWEDEALTKTGD